MAPRHLAGGREVPGPPVGDDLQAPGGRAEVHRRPAVRPRREPAELAALRPSPRVDREGQRARGGPPASRGGGGSRALGPAARKEGNLRAVAATEGAPPRSR